MEEHLSLKVSVWMMMEKKERVFVVKKAQEEEKFQCRVSSGKKECFHFLFASSVKLKHPPVPFILEREKEKDTLVILGFLSFYSWPLFPVSYFGSFYSSSPYTCHCQAVKRSEKKEEKRKKRKHKTGEMRNTHILKQEEEEEKVSVSNVIQEQLDGHNLYNTWDFSSFHISSCELLYFNSFFFNLWINQQEKERRKRKKKKKKNVQKQRYQVK